MNLYDRQAIHRLWLGEARGDTRVVENALKRANEKAVNKGKSTTSEMVIEEIRKLVGAYA